MADARDDILGDVRGDVRGDLPRGFRSLPRAVRWTAYAAVLVVLVLVAVLVAAVVVVRRPLPQTDGRATLPGLTGDVTVVRDAHGIPQLYGDSVDDLVRAQGYVAAQDRFFQMDVERHATSGRLAELIGPSGLANDELVRTLGWRRIAEQELGLADPQTREALQAYADGVNAYLAQRSPAQLSLEYAVLGAGGLDYHPPDWTPVDSLTWLKAFAWDLHGNTTDEIDRALATAAVGPAMTAELYPAYPTDHAPIVDQGAVVDGVYEQDATSGGTRDPLRPPPFAAAATSTLERVARAMDRAPAWLGRGDGVGSNSWVVDGAHSATGEPLLADDPHLGLGLPGTWEQVGLHCRTVSSSCPLDVSGVALAGVPGVVIGHNDHISWGLTDLQADTADLFLERLRGTGADAEALDGDVWEPVRTRQETIRVEGGEDVTLLVRSTRHGPLLSDVSDDVADAGDGMGVAVEWTGLQPGTTADLVLGLDLATDWADFRAAAARVGSPTLSLVYADTAGHIGYQAAGRVPIRKSGNDGRQPADGWLRQDDWTDQSVPFAGLPTVEDPDDGYVVAANQATAPHDYPYFLTADGDRGYRAERIRELLSGRKPTVDDMTDIQLDTVDPMAATLVPYLLDAHLPAGYDSDGQRLLRDWDLTQPASGRNSAAAAYFDVVWSELLALTFHDELPRAVWPDGGQRWYAVVARLLPEPDSTWWDDLATDGTTERRDDIIRSAMIDARDELTRREGLDPSTWSWGRLHTVDLRSPAVVGGSHRTLRELFDRDDWRVGGGSGAVDATSWDAAEGYAVTTAPSMRMVVSVADWDDSRWIDLTGASGHVLADDYTDQTDLWADGRTLPWLFSTDAAEAAGRHTLTLEPGS